MPGNEQIVAEWIKKADVDELSATVLLEMHKGSPETICFLSQQIAEKYLKAFLISQELKFPKIHQLDLLLGRCLAVDRSFEKLRTSVLQLNDFYTETRYPSDYIELKWTDAKKAYQNAQTIKSFIRSKL